MTSMERAKKMLADETIAVVFGDVLHVKPGFKERLAAQIEEVERETWTAAREKAKGIAKLWQDSKTCNADGTPCDHQRQALEIAQCIGEMEPR